MALGGAARSVPWLLLDTLLSKSASGCGVMDLELGSVLGSGSYGAVYRGILYQTVSPSGSPEPTADASPNASGARPKRAVAVKAIPCDSNKDILNEINLMRAARSEHVVELLACFAHASRAWLVLEVRARELEPSRCLPAPCDGSERKLPS